MKNLLLILSLLLANTLSLWGDAPAVTHSQYNLGMKMYKRGQFSLAAQEFNRLLQFKDLNASRFIRNSTEFMTGFSLYKVGKYRSALFHFKSLKERYTNAALGRAAAFLFADCLRLMNKHSNALFYYSRFYRRYSSHALADDALYWSGMIYYEAKQYSKAKALFRQLIMSYPKSSSYEAAKARLLVLTYMKNPPKRDTIKKADGDRKLPRDSAAIKKLRQELAKRKVALDKKSVALAKKALHLKHLSLLLKVKEKNLEALIKVLKVQEAALKQKEKELKAFENK